MSYVKLPFAPGVFADDTALAAEGASVASDKGRFVRSRFQSIGGNEIATEDTFNGICRSLFTWRDNTAAAYCGIGTHKEIDVYYDADIYEITPIIARGQLTNPFTTSLASATISVSFTGHGMSADQRITWPSQTTFNGATISSVHGYEITVVGADNFTFTAGSAATSSGTGGGTVNYAKYLAPGNENGAGPGYGVGPFGIGNYGNASATDYFVRTVAQDSWGQNLLVCPRGGSIYEWAPNFTATEEVTNGDFASGTGWTAGTGWVITGGAATATFGSQSSLQTSVSLNTNAYFLLTFDITRVQGDLTATLGTGAVTSSFNSSQHVQTVLYNQDATALKFIKNSSFQGSIDNVSLTQLITAHLLPGAPTQNTFMLVTPEDIVMVFGTIDIESGLFDPLGVRWSDTGRGDRSANQTWIPLPSNLSAGTHLAKGGRVVSARNGRGEVLAWTDSALYGGRYVPDTTVVYDFVLIAEGCGLIGPNAVTIRAGIAYWETPSGEYYAYGGGGSAPQALESPMRRDIFDHLAKAQGDKVFAFSCSAYSEAWFLYPDNRDGTGDECSRYGMTNAENQWANGTFDRTAWVDAGVMNYPMAASTTGMLFFQEKGNSDNGAAFSWSRTTGVIPIGDGNTLFGIRSFFPNFDDWIGGCTLTIYMMNDPNGPITTFGPYAVATNATKVDLGPLFPTGKFAQFIIAGSSAPAFAREGTHMIDIYDTGMVF